MTTGVYDDPENGPTVIHFPVPLRSEGVRLLDTWKVLGMRGTGSQDIELDRVFVPDDATKGVRCPVGKWHPFMHAVVLVALPVFYSAYLESPRPRGTWRSASAALCRRTILVNAAIAAVQKAMEVAGGAGFFPF
jgi:alkylation response protein AidB-like acyl-CoA dehydrogenase